MSLGYALRQRSASRTLPFLHWEIDRPLTADARQEVITAFAPDTPWDDSNSSLHSLRGESEGSRQCSVNRDNVAQFPALGNLIDDLLNRKTIERIEAMLSQSMDGGFLNLQFACDSRSPGRTPYAEQPATLMTMLISVSSTDSAAQRPTAFSQRDNVGWMFVPTDEAWRELNAQSSIVDARLLHIAYVREATDWKLPPKRSAKVA